MKRPQYWDLYESLAGPAKKSVSEYVKTWQSHGHLAMPPRAVLELDDAITAAIYHELAQERWRDGHFPSPVADQNDSSWMVRSDFCFVNARACGLDRDRPGSFIDAMRLLLALPASAIHLAPFFECVFGNVYAVNSLTHINPECVKSDWKHAGLDALSQLRLLVDAAHILGKTVGFDLEPHTAQFSRVVLDQPEYFRWLSLSDDRSSLRGGLTQDEMLESKVQTYLVSQVREIVQAQYVKAGIKRLEDGNLDTLDSRQVQNLIISQLIGQGLWTIPCHTWGGVGLPGFARYHHEGQYPVFEYLDAEGEDQSAHAFGMLTPIAMSSGLQVNTAPTEDEPSIPWQPGIDRLAEIFPHVQSLAPFDFVRLDYVDHVFDSVVEGTDDIPLSDRLTPAAIRQVIQTAKAESSCIGAMAERMGYDLEPYAEVGFDLILGADILRPIDPDFLTDMLKFQSEIEDLNAKRQVPVSIQYAIDTHDTGHPQIDSVPAKLGRKSVLLRILLAGLGCAGLGRRPMYEVMGNQDMTVGLYQANNRPVSLEWRNDLEFYQSQLRVRAFLDTFRPLLSASSIRETQIGLAWVLWCIDRLDGIRQRLVCICRPESGTLDKDARDIQVYPFNQYWFDEARVEEYDIATGTSSFVPIEVDGTIALGRMSRGSFRVFLIRENGQDMNGVWV